MDSCHRLKLIGMLILITLMIPTAFEMDMHWLSVVTCSSFWPAVCSSFIHSDIYQCLLSGYLISDPVSLGKRERLLWALYYTVWQKKGTEVQKHAKASQNLAKATKMYQIKKRMTIYVIHSLILSLAVFVDNVCSARSRMFLWTLLFVFLIDNLYSVLFSSFLDLNWLNLSKEFLLSFSAWLTTYASTIYINLSLITFNFNSF